MKFFNTAGPVNPEKHYCVERDFDGLDVQELIDQEKYFILHAPRQTGKTTLVQKFVKSLNVQETFKALYVNIEPAQAARNNTPEGLRCILEQFRNAIAATFGDNDPAIPYLNKIIKNLIVSFSALESFLQFWAKYQNKLTFPHAIATFCPRKKIWVGKKRTRLLYMTHMNDNV